MNSLMKAAIVSAPPTLALMAVPEVVATIPAPRISKRDRGTPLGAGTKRGEPFNDARGNTYVRMPDGSIRRMNPKRQ